MLMHEILYIFHFLYAISELSRSRILISFWSYNYDSSYAKPHNTLEMQPNEIWARGLRSGGCRGAFSGLRTAPPLSSIMHVSSYTEAARLHLNGKRDYPLEEKKRNII
jgi:hypothetical protein